MDALKQSVQKAAGAPTTSKGKASSEAKVKMAPSARARKTTKKKSKKSG